MKRCYLNLFFVLTAFFLAFPAMAQNPVRRRRFLRPDLGGGAFVTIEALDDLALDETNLIR